ncbi:MAG: hypothetical protein IKX67_06970 [Bacteroidales bacterium]|nr:hypothetical protein [Bacteroidales bacterium]
MKKYLFIVAVATLFFSCNKELEPTAPTTTDRFTFKASIEQLAEPTKATINGSNQLVWAQDDKIGIYVTTSNWTDKNQPFTLDGEGGATTGDFKWDYNGDFPAADATAAFFPWQGTGSDKNNVANSSIYFKLPGSYSNYTSGQMFTPLVAKLNGSTDPIAFKHAGAAVKVTFNNLPAGVHSLGMTVDGQQVYGDFSVEIENAGTAAMTPDNVVATNNTIWLNIAPADAEREFTFLFPVPALTTPKLSFQMYDENNILVWQKNLKAQPSSLGRGDVLVMPALDNINPYAQFKEISSKWTVIGTANGSNWDKDFAMFTDGTICIAKGLTFEANGEFKIRQNKSWDNASYGNNGNNVVVSAAGSYDIIFNSETKEVKAVPSKCAYPDANVDVTLYFCAANPVSKACLSSYGLGCTEAWPGHELTESEIFSGSRWYKFTIAAASVWGKQIKYYFHGGSWATSESTADFSNMKTEYYFIAAKDQLATQLNVKPMAPEITIDGTFADWADVVGTTKASDTGNVSLLKAYTDGTDLYFYNKMTPGDGVTFDLSGWRYFRMYFDTDNDATTGWDTSHWLYAGSDSILYGEDGNKHCILVYHSKAGVENADINGVSGTYVLKSVSNADGTIEVELKFSLSELGTISGDEIKIFTSGSVASDQAVYGIINMIVPSAS